MTCPKCAAIMFLAPSLRHLASDDYHVVLTDVRAACQSYYCLICGAYLDQVIVANRVRQADERRLIRHAESIARRAMLGLREGSAHE